MSETFKNDEPYQTQNGEKPPKIEQTEYITYKYRWIILGLYSLASFASAFQWPMYVIIDNVVEKYYSVSLETVNLTATVFLLAYVVCIYPATYLLQRMGLRFAVIVAAVGPWIASLLKLLSVHTDRFWILVLSQSIIGVTQIYVSILPASIAAEWFGPSQVSTACSLGSAGMQIALALGCLIPPTMVGNDLQNDNIESALGRLNTGVLVFTSVVLILVLLLFKAEPATPPSESRQKLKETKINLAHSTKNLIKDVPFFLFWIGFSSMVGILYTLCFLLNATVLSYYPNNVSDVGTMGLLFMIVGVLGAAVFGIALDKYRRFKETAVVANVLSSISMVLFTLTMSYGIAYFYVFQIALGFFFTATVSIGLEVGAEITYPLPENISSGFLLIGSKLFGFVFTSIFSSLFAANFGIWTYIGMSLITICATVLVIFIRFDLKRQAALLNSK